jgi:hypothetical protein
MQHPQEFMGVSAPYPGATIAQTMNASGTVMVTMESNDNPDSIVEFYKKELAANGCKITAENHSQGHSDLMGEKGSNNVIVNIGKGQSGKSIIGLMLAPKQ